MRFSRSGFRRYLGNTGWLVAGQAYSILVGLAVTVVVARYLGPGGFGQLNFYWSLVVMLGVLGNLGIPPILYRELVKSPDSRNRLLGTSVVYMTFAGAMLFFGFALAGLLFNPGSVPLWLMLLMGLTLLLNPFKCIEIWFTIPVLLARSLFPALVRFRFHEPAVYGLRMLGHRFHCLPQNPVLGFMQVRALFVLLRLPQIRNLPNG